MNRPSDRDRRKFGSSGQFRAGRPSADEQSGHRDLIGTAVLRITASICPDGLLVIVVTVDATTGVVIAGADIVSRGFVYVKEAEEGSHGELRTISQMALDRCSMKRKSA